MNNLSTRGVFSLNKIQMRLTASFLTFILAFSNTNFAVIAEDDIGKLTEINSYEEPKTDQEPETGNNGGNDEDPDNTPTGDDAAVGDTDRDDDEGSDEDDEEAAADEEIALFEEEQEIVEESSAEDNILTKGDSSEVVYYLYANGHELNSSDWYEISYDEDVSFSAKRVEGESTETYSSGVMVFYASSVEGLTPGTVWSQTPEVGDYYLSFAVPANEIAPSGADFNYRVRITDGDAPEISEFTVSGENISIKATDAGSGVTAVSLSTSETEPDTWTAVENAPVKDSVASISLHYDELESGVYYLYVKDASSNVARSDGAIAVTWLSVEKYYKNGSLSQYRSVYAAAEGTEVTALLPAPDTRTKFDFSGYYTDEDYSGTSYAAGTNADLSEGEDNTLYARWTLKGVEFAENLNSEYSKTYDSEETLLSVALSDTYDSLSWTWYRADSADGTYSAVDGASGSSLGIKDVNESGYYKAVATITEEGEESTKESATAHVVIEKKDLYVTIDNMQISYLDPVPEYTITATGFAGSDNLESVFGDDYAQKLGCAYRNDSEARSGAGAYPITAGNLDAVNYSLSVTEGILTVNPLEITENDTVNVTLQQGPFDYRGSPIEPLVEGVSVILASDPSAQEMVLSSADYAISYSNNVNVGTQAKVVITFTGNLTGEYSGKTFEISKGYYPVNTTISHDSWKYGEKPADLSVGVDDTKGGAITYYYLPVGEEESFDAADKSGATASVPVNAGRYYVWAEIAETANYSAITAQPAIFEITKRHIVLTSGSKTWPYDGNPHTFGDYTQTGDGFVEGEGFHSVTVSGSVRTVQESPVVNDIAYALTSATKESNYDIEVNKGELTITRAPLPKITSLKWGTEPGDLKWVAITRDGLNIKYELRIYKDGSTLLDSIVTTDTQYNVKDLLIQDSIENGIGGYTATITARIDEDPLEMYKNYTEGSESEKIANKYTAKLGLVRNGGDVGVESLSFTGAMHADTDPDTASYLLQGESINANVTYVDGYENDDELSVFNYRTGSEGLSKGAYTKVGYYTVRFSNGTISGPVDADLVIKTKDSAPICEEYSAEQADDYSYVRAQIRIKDTLGLYGYKIVNSVDNITDDNWIEIDHEINGTPAKTFSTTSDFSAEGNYYLVFKDSGNNIRYCETPVTVYKISFDKNDAQAQGSMSPIYKLKDSTVILPGNAFTKAGYVFTNWTAGSSLLPDGASYVKNESVVLKAGWTDRKFSYRVNYYYQQLTADGDNIILSYPETPDGTSEFSCAYNAVVSYNDAALQQEREGYRLTGTPALPDESPAYVPSISVTADGMELNIYYNLEKYTMTYTYTDYDKSVKTVSDEFYYGQTFVEREKPSRTGYSFMGWNYGDSGMAPETMPATNLSATGYFKANTSSYIIRYYFQNIDTTNAAGNYLGASFGLDETVQRDEIISADYGKEINAYVEGGADAPGKETVVARQITGFEPKAVIVSYGTSEAKSFDSLSALNAFAENASYDEDLTHNVYSQLEGEIPEGVQNGPTIVSFYYTRKTYNLSMNVYLGNRDDGKCLFGATYPEDNASWTFPYGYAFPASGELSAEWFETYGYLSQGETTYPNGKKHSTAWTARWSEFETEVTADKYYLASFVDWSTGARPSAMPAGDVTVVREYASREQSKYVIDVYIEKIKKVNDTYNGVAYERDDGGLFEKETSFERYIEPGKTVSIVDSGEGSETQIPVSKLIEGIEAKEHYEHVALPQEVLSGVVIENQYEEDNTTIKPETVTVLKLYISRKSYNIKINYYRRDYDGDNYTESKITSYTINQKWGTSYFIDSEYYYNGETGPVNAENANTYIGTVTGTEAVNNTDDFASQGYTVANYWRYVSPSPNVQLGYTGGHGDYTQYTDSYPVENDRFKKIRVGVNNNDTYANIYYLQPVNDRHYYLKLTYYKYEDGELVSNSAPLTYNLGGEDYQICVANKSDVFESSDENAALRNEFEAVDVTYSGIDITGERTGTFYKLISDEHSPKLLFTVVDDDRFYVGNLASFNYNSNVPAHIGRENFDSEDNDPAPKYGTGTRYARGDERLATSGSPTPIKGVAGSSEDYCQNQLSYYFEFVKDFAITYIFDGKSRRVDYGVITTVPLDKVGYDTGDFQVFDPGEGYEIVWYKDPAFTQPVNAPIEVTRGVTLYGKRFNKPIENFDIAYYQMPGTDAYYTGNLSDLYSETEDIQIAYQFDSNTIVNKTGTYTKYYNNDSEKTLYAVKKSHFVKAFTEFSMDYGSYVIEGFEHDDKNTSNVLSGFCGSKSINLRSYYDRTSALLTIRRNDSDTNANDETAIKVNASTIKVDDPVKIGYTFTGWKMYNYTGGVKVAELDPDDYDYTYVPVDHTHMGFTQFKMPICETLLEAVWTPAVIDFEIVHLFQDNNKVYQQELLDKARRSESTPVTVVTDVQGNVTYYYTETVNDNNLFAAVETLDGVKSEDVIDVNDHDLGISTVSFANGTYTHNANDSGNLDKTEAHTFRAYYDAVVTFYYERDNSIVITAGAYCLDATGDTGLSISGSGSYYYGQQVNLFAIMQPTGYEFKGWFRVNSGEELTQEQVADLRTLIQNADTEGSLLTTVSGLTQHTFSATQSGYYIAVSDALAAIQPTITITITRDLEHDPLYYNYAPDAQNQFNAAINWGEGVDAGANNIKEYTWYYISFEDMSKDEYDQLDPEEIDTSAMTPIANSNTSTFNLPTGYNAGFYVLRCVAEIERKDNGRTEIAQGSYKFEVHPNADYLQTIPVVGRSYTGATFSYTEKWIYDFSGRTVYYSEEPFTLGEDVQARLALSEDDTAKAYTVKPGYKDVIVDDSHNPTPHVVYYYVISTDPNYASVTGSETIEILPVPVTVTAVKPFTKIYDGTEEILGKPQGEVGTITYKYSEQDGTYSDYYRLQSGIESPGAARSPYYKINGILAADTGKTMMLNFDASFDYMHAGGSGREEGTLVTLNNLWVITEDELHSVYENWNYVFPQGEVLQLSGQIKPYPLDIKWLPDSVSDEDATYTTDDFKYNYTGSPIAPYIKIVGDTSRIPDATGSFSVAVKNKQTNAGLYSAIPEVEAVEGARYFPTDYTFTLENQTYRILPRYIKIYPKNVTKVYNAANQTMLDSEDEFAFETKESEGDTYTEYTLPAGEHYNALASASYKNAGVYPGIRAKNLTIYTLDEHNKKNVITDNYVIEYGQGTLTIEKCPVVINGITGVNKEYDGTSLADLNIEEAQIRLAIDGTSTIYPGDSLVLEKIEMPGDFSDKYVGNNKTVTINYTEPGSSERGLAFKETGAYGNYVIDVSASQAQTTANILKDGKVNVTVKGGDAEIIYGETLTDSHFEYEIHGLHGDDSLEDEDFEIEDGHPKFMIMKQNGSAYENVMGEGYSFEGSDNLDFIRNLDAGTYYVFFVEKTGEENDGHHFVKGFNSPKYNVSWDYEHPATITILPRPITVAGVSTADAVTKVYDGNDSVDGDSKTLIMGSQTSHGYYTFGAVENNDESGVLARDAASLAIINLAAKYNDKNVARTLGADIVGATKVLVSDAVLGGDAASNYELVNDEFEVPGAITPKALTVKVNNQTITYGSAPEEYDYTIEGAVAADEELILEGLGNTALTKVNCRYEAVATPAAGNSHDCGYYAMNVDENVHYANPNYAITFPVANGLPGETYGLLSVVKKDLTYRAKNVFISYGVQNPPTIFDGEFDSTDLVYGDTVKTQKLENETAKIISGTSGSDIAVYTDSALSSDAGTYGVIFASTADNDSLPGDYTVTPTNVASGDGGLYTKNYNIIADSGTLTIKKYYILVSGVKVLDKVYDGTTDVTTSGTGNQIDLSDAVFKYYVGATSYVQSYAQLPAAFAQSFDTADFTASYASKDVGSNINVSLQIRIKEGSELESRYMLLTADNSSEAGEFDSDNIFGNDVTQTSAVSNIYAKDLTLKPDDFSIGYAQAVPSSKVVVNADGFVGEETIADIPGFTKAYTFSPEYVPGSDTGAYTVDISTSAPGAGVHGNYNISFDTGTMTVTRVTFPAPTGIEWNAGRLSWNAVEPIGNVSPAGYKLQLFKDGEAVTTIDCHNGTEYDFSSLIRVAGKGTYTVKICAVADTQNNAAYKNVDQFGLLATSGEKKAVLVTPAYSSDAVTQKAIDALANKNLYVTPGSFSDSYVVIAGEALGINVFYKWAGRGADNNVYDSGYEIDSFTSSVESGVTLSTTLDNSASGEFTGNAQITDTVEDTEIQLVLKLKKRAAQGSLTIAADSDSAPYGALLHPEYRAVVTHLEDVEYTYTYNWYYKLGYITYDETNAGKDLVRTIDENGGVVVTENDIVWDGQSFTFPRGKRAQTYDVYCDVIATRKDNSETATLSSNKAFTITKPTAGDSNYLILSANNWDYGSARRPATCTPLFGAEMGDVTILYRQKGQGASAWKAEVPTEAGIYEVQARSAGTESYPAVTSETKEFTINKMSLETPSNFEMVPDGNGNPYGLLTWDPVSGYSENAGVSPASEVTVTYEVTILYTSNLIGTIDEADVVDTRIVDGTQLGVIDYIEEDGGYFFRIRALANERTAQGNHNCDDSGYTTVNTPLIGAKITTDAAENTKEYDASPITMTAGYTDNSEHYWFRWFKNGEIIPGAEDRTYQITEVNESGLYSVEVKSDNAGDNWIASKVIRVTVTKRPVVITASSDEKTYDNTPLSCEGTFTGAGLTSDMYSIEYAGAVPGSAPLAQGEAVTSLTFTGSITDAGTADNMPGQVVIKNGATEKTSNYAVTYTPGTLTVGKKSATIKAPDDTKVYDGTPLTAPGFGDTVPVGKKAVITGLVQGHEPSALSMTADSTITNVGQQANVVDLTSIGIIDTQDGDRDVSANYEFTKEDGLLTVTKAPATIEVSDLTVTYDGTAKTISAEMSGEHATEVFSGAELRYALESTPDNDSLYLSFIHAGVYRIVVTLAESDNHLAATPVVATLTINPRDLTIKGVTKAKEYDAEPHHLADTEFTITEGSSLAQGDTIASIDVYNDELAVKVGETEDSHVRDAVIKNGAGATVNGDYSITYSDGELSFTPRNITLTAKDHEKKYDGTALTYVGPVDTSAMNDDDNEFYVVGGSGLAGDDTVTQITVSGTVTMQGTAAAIPSAAEIKNDADDVTGCYNITYENGTLKVTKRSITVTAIDHTKAYDGEALSYSGEYTDNTLYEIGGDGLASGDAAVSLTLSGYQMTAGESPIVPGDIIIRNGDEVRTGNYDFQYVNGTLKINASGLVIRAKEISRVYNGETLSYENSGFAVKQSAITVEGLLAGDTLTGITLTGSITDAGEVALVPSAAVVTRGTDNVTASYDISYINGKLKVTARPLTVTADNKQSVYGDETMQLTYEITSGSEITGAEAGITVNCEATSSSPAGGYDIVPVCNNNNYMLTPVNGIYTVTKRPVTITADSAEEEYVPGLVLTKDTASVTEGDLAQDDIIASVTVNGSISAVGTTPNIPSGAVIKKGSLDVTDSYEITYANGTLTVNKGTQEIIAEDLEIEYDGRPHTADEIEKSLKYDDSSIISVSPGSAEITDAGELEVVLSTTGNDNFKPAEKTVKIKISKRKITIAADSAKKKYDGKALSKESWSIVKGTLADNESIVEDSITVRADNEEGYIIEVGQVANKISGEAVIMNSGRDVSACYEVTYNDGKLVIERVKKEKGGSGDNSDTDDDSYTQKDNPSPAPEQTEDPKMAEPEKPAPTSPEIDIRKHDTPESEEVTDLTTTEDNESSSDVQEETDDLSGDDGLIKYIIGTKKDDKDIDPRENVKGKIADCEVVSADIERMVNELLTDDEKADVEKSEDLRFRVQVLRDDDRLTEDVKDSIKKALPENFGIVGAIDASLFVKIGDKPERRIEDKYSFVDVTVTLPEEMWDDEMAGNSMLLRTYINENGEVITEVAVSEINGRSFDMGMDNFSTYTLAAKAEIIAKLHCFIHWLILLMMILSILAIAIHYGRRKKDDKEETAADDDKDKKDKKRMLYMSLILFNTAGAVLVLFGSCEYDLPAEILSVVVTVVLEAIMSRRNKKEDKR